MDLDTLPDEMLTSIVKHANFKTRRHLRKMNERIDKLARRANLYGKIEVQTILILNDWMLFGLSEEFATKTNFNTCYCREWENESDYMKILDELLGGITVVKELRFGRRQFSDKDVQLMNKNKKSLRNLKTLTFEHVDFALSKTNVNTFMKNVCTNVDEIQILMSEHSEKIFNAALLSCRRWRNLRLYEPDLPLDDNFLQKVVVNCEKTEFRLFHSLFTVRGVLAMLKKCFINSEDKQNLRLEDVRLGHVRLDEIEPLFRAEIPGIEIKMEERAGTRRFDITLPGKPKRCRFSVIIEQQGI